MRQVVRHHPWVDMSTPRRGIENRPDLKCRLQICGAFLIRSHLTMGLQPHHQHLHT